MPAFRMIAGPWPMVVIVVPLTNSVLTIDPSAIEILNYWELIWWVLTSPHGKLIWWELTLWELIL